MSGYFPERQRNGRFAQGHAKRVDYAAAWDRRNRGIERESQAEEDFFAVIDAIGAGNLVPERCYRHGIDRNHPRDELLEDRGIKHLHLGGANSDIILYLVEYEEFVLFLEIGTTRILKPLLLDRSSRRSITIACVVRTLKLLLIEAAGSHQRQSFSSRACCLAGSETSRQIGAREFPFATFSKDRRHAHLTRPAFQDVQNMRLLSRKRR